MVFGLYDLEGRTEKSVENLLPSSDPSEDIEDEDLCEGADLGEDEAAEPLDEYESDILIGGVGAIGAIGAIGAVGATGLAGATGATGATGEVGSCKEEGFDPVRWMLAAEPRASISHLVQVAAATSRTSTFFRSVALARPTSSDSEAIRSISLSDICVIFEGEMRFSSPSMRQFSTARLATLSTKLFNATE